MAIFIPTDPLRVDTSSSDEDLRQRSTMLAADNVDDLIVALGLLAAGRLEGGGLTVSEIVDLGNPYAIGEALESSRNELQCSAIRLFYDLWYRLKIPFACASLQWWYLLSLALRDTDRAPEQALAVASHWVERLSAVANGEQPRLFVELVGLPGEGDPIFTDADIADVAGFARAVMDEVPFIPLLRSTVTPGRRALSPERASTYSLCHDRLCCLDNLSNEALDAWLELTAEDRTALLIELQQRVACLEQIRLSTGAQTLNNAAFAAELDGCAEVSPQSWSHQQLTLATLAWCWREAGFVIQEFNQSLIFLPTLMMFMEKRIGDYDAVLGIRSPKPDGLIDAARLLGRRRTEVERDHLRCISFDGSNWERREFLVRRDSLIAPEALPSELQEVLERRFGVGFPGHGGCLEAWDDYLEQILERGATPTDLICCVAEWAANATDLHVDYAIFTVPQGVRLDRPWELELTEVFCYTAFRRGLDPARGGVPFDYIGIQNAIGQRMRYNVVKKAQNYALVRRFPAQSFNLPDIAIGEDANHGGHRAGGVRLSCRVPTAIDWRGRTWRGLADVRLNRLHYTPTNEFRPQDLPVAFRYVKWEKGIADAAYRRNLLFDKHYCGKLERTTGTDESTARALCAGGNGRVHSDADGASKGIVGVARGAIATDKK